MRLLIYDPEHISHSTDVVRRGLLPQLARRVERLVWLLPESRHPYYYDWRSREPAIELAGFEASPRNPIRWLDAILRRMQTADFKNRSGVVARLRGRLQARSAVREAREMDATWIFCPSFMNQPIPKSSFPLAGMIYDVSSTLPSRTLENMDRWVLAAAVTFCISEFTRQQVLVRLPQANRERLVVTPLCPLAASQPSPQREHSGIGTTCAGRLRVLCPATFTERKGQAVLLEAARRCHDRGVRIELVFSGSGTEALIEPRAQQSSWALAACRAYQSFVDAGGTAQALGHVADAELEAIHEEVDAVVFPTHYEGFGLPVSEAVQRGLPVIASDLPPIREQLGLFACHDRVRMVRPGDVAALAEALEDFAAGRAPMRQSPAAMAQHFARWTWGDVAGRMIENLLGHGGAV